MFLLIVYDRIDTRRTVPPNDKECDGRNGPCACRYFEFDSKEIILFFKTTSPCQCSGSAVPVARVRSWPVCNRRVPYCSVLGTGQGYSMVLSQCHSQ